MNKILAWFAASRIRLSLSHVAEAFLIQVPVFAFAMITGTPIVFALRASIIAVVAWYWSSKRMEVETAADTGGESHAFVWMYGWFPWQWSFYQQMDVLFPTLSSTAVALIVWKIFA